MRHKNLVIISKMAKKKVGSVHTAKNGARYKIMPNGRARFISGPTKRAGGKKKGGGMMHKHKKGGGMHMHKKGGGMYKMGAGMGNKMGSMMMY